LIAEGHLPRWKPYLTYGMIPDNMNTYNLLEISVEFPDFLRIVLLSTLKCQINLKPITNKYNSETLWVCSHL